MLSLALLSFGGCISILNFYLSFLRYPLHVLRGGNKDNFQWVSGFPLVGTVFLLAALLLDGPDIIYGFDMERISGALTRLGYKISDRQNGARIAPPPADDGTSPL